MSHPIIILCPGEISQSCLGLSSMFPTPCTSHTPSRPFSLSFSTSSSLVFSSSCLLSQVTPRSSFLCFMLFLHLCPSLCHSLMLFGDYFLSLSTSLFFTQVCYAPPAPIPWLGFQMLSMFLSRIILNLLNYYSFGQAQPQPSSTKWDCVWINLALSTNIDK